LATPTHDVLAVAPQSRLTPSDSPRLSTSTPGKLAPSPAYYDYTEDFHQDELPSGASPKYDSQPPPKFRIDRTIYEEQLPSTESLHEETSGRVQYPCNTLSTSLDDSGIIYQQELPHALTNAPTAAMSTITTTAISTNANPVLKPVGEALVRDGYGGPNVQAHAARQPTIAKNALAARGHPNLQSSVDASNAVSQLSNHAVETDLVLNDSASFRVSSLLPQFPQPQTRALTRNPVETATEAPGRQMTDVSGGERVVDEMFRRAIPPRETDSARSPSPPRLVSSDGSIYSDQFPADIGFNMARHSHLLEEVNRRPNTTTSIDHGLRDLADLIRSYEAANRSPHPSVSTSAQFLGSHTPFNFEGGNYSKISAFSNNAKGPVMHDFHGRSKSPMLAPLPISPARALKLKASIPQLMKALPPVPRDSVYTNPDQEQTITLLNSAATNTPDNNSKSEYAAMFDGKGGQGGQFGLHGPNFSADALPAPVDSPTWRLNIDQSWVPQQADQQSQSELPEPFNPQMTPDLKLGGDRINGPSGTVKVNADAVKWTPFGKFELRHPRDLFTSPSNVSETPRKVDDKSGTEVTMLSAGGSTVQQSLMSPASANPISPADVRSFFSDGSSSETPVRRGLRKRLSNLRARLPHPYPSRSAVNASGNSTPQRRSKDTVTGEPSAHSIGVETPELDDYGVPIAVRSPGLKKKVSLWFRERMAATRNGKRRGSDEIGCMPIHR
jgi:hypothetical protein